MNNRQVSQNLDKPHGPISAKSLKKLLEFLLGALACIPIVLFFVTSLGRLHYPYPLEQLEGSMLLAALRVAHGLPIYVQPNFHFIPYMYAPGYYYVSGWALRLLGPTFVPLRVVSLLSVCGSFFLIYILVLVDSPRAETSKYAAAFLGAGMYATAYPWTHGWFDLGRLDSFYIFLLLLALFCTRKLHPIIAAAAWTLVFLTKQTILPVALILLCFEWKRPRRLLLGLGSFVLMAGVSFGLINHATGGWFRFYAFTVPHANADLLLRPFVFFLPSELIAPFGAVLLVIAIAWVYTRPNMQHPATRFYLVAGISTLALCWFLQAHGGATANTPMPLYAVLAIAFGISFARIQTRLTAESQWKAANVLLAVLAVIPLISWVYSPHEYTPKPPVRAAHEELIQWLKSFPGDVFLPAHPYEAIAAGKEWHPDTAASHDALRPDIPAIRQPLLNAIRAEIDGEKFDAIGLDDSPAQALAEETWLPSDLTRHYPIVGIVPGGDVFDPFGPHAVYFLLPCREKALALAKGWTLLQMDGKVPCLH